MLDFKLQNACSNITHFQCFMVQTQFSYSVMYKLVVVLI